MDSRIAQAVKLRYPPVATLFANEKPEGALSFTPGRWGCVISLMTAAARGKTAAISRETMGCPGGISGLGFGCGWENIPGGFDYFLSTGRGEGFPEGEGYKKTPELVSTFREAVPLADIPFTYVIFQPLTRLAPGEQPVLVTFYATADQLSALTVLANYGLPGNENVITPMGAGCHTVVLIPYHESQQERPRAVIGLLDVSARPFVDADLLGLTVPWAMFQQMEEDVSGSFLDRPAWAKVRARIPDPKA